MKKFPKLPVIISLFLLLTIIGTQTLTVFHFVDHFLELDYFGFGLLITFLLFLIISVKEHFNLYTKYKRESSYGSKLDDVIIFQSKNSLFYEGSTDDAAKALTREVVNSMGVDRCSVWLYKEDRTSIICQELFENGTWTSGFELFKVDYRPYFLSLLLNPVIVADDAETHPATSCFTESYLKPLGIKSMLDVPIFHKGEVIGVICIESYKRRSWCGLELNFAQMLSSLYSFTHSVQENNIVHRNIEDIEKFIDYSVLVSKADKNGKITYVNKKFEDVSGWKLKDAYGMDHNIVNSGYHPKSYWKKMYNTIIKERKIWNDVVTNVSKDGELYWVDSYIMAEFSPITNELEGFMSIRYDVSELVKKSNEIEKKNTYLEHAAKILRHDMHSGINTYIPRGVSSLERRLTDDDIKRLKIENPLKMIKEGLLHSQKVYRGVYEFTNLVKKDVVLEKTECNLKTILDNYLSTTSYKSQVIIDELIDTEVNEPLFCTAIDNLIRNGLKYNDSDTKFVKIFMEKGNLVIQDNGRGLTQEEFNRLSKPYVRKEGQKESGSGLGLNICLAILSEHGFNVSCQKNNIGTKLTIKLK